MARVNVGVNPRYLTDQHLCAEHVEITMITGSLKVNNYKIKSFIPLTFSLGKGHINFFKIKLLYLSTRLEEVKKEMIRRGFRASCTIKLDDFPSQYHQNWSPSVKDSKIIRQRVIQKLYLKPTWYRYQRQNILEFEAFCHDLKNSELYFV